MPVGTIASLLSPTLQALAEWAAPSFHVAPAFAVKVSWCSCRAHENRECTCSDTTGRLDQVVGPPQSPWDQGSQENQ